ncbi:hypothetical protein Bca4012_033685 [Brassica carinata]|uniref:Uncharacterized protein n=1 Tax=Brassica carinata TaxID=52824 RepID=A0A8X7UN13_BRACI|nr:hypothetical protein Bca52824_045444 [Brassica carinata]
MARRYSRSEKGKWQAPPEPPTKRPPVRIPANDCDDLIEANRLTVIGRLTNPMVQKPRAVIDFMAQEADCLQRPQNAPPKKRMLGITQSIALQRIEAEKRRHDDRRGYRRPEESRPITRTPTAGYSQTRRDRSSEVRHYSREGDYGRDNSILSRTARSNSGYRRTRHSSGSSAPHHNPIVQSVVAASTGIIPIVQTEVHQQNLTPTRNVRDRLSDPVGETVTQAPAPHLEITPARNLQSRIEIPGASREGTHSGSHERRSALERLAEEKLRKPPNFESGRLQEPSDHMETEEQLAPANISATTRSNNPIAGTSRRVGHSIPIAAQSKTAGKRKVPAKKRIARSPRQTLVQRRSTTSSSSTTARRRLVGNGDTTLPCNKAVTSKQQTKTGPPNMSLHFVHYFSIPPIGLSGGLSLFWNDDTDITILESNPNLVDTRIVHKVVTSFVSFVYGAPATEDRAAYWQKLNVAWHHSPLHSVIEKLNACRRGIIRWAKEQKEQSNLIIKQNQEALEMNIYMSNLLIKLDRFGNVIFIINLNIRYHLDE